ALFSVHVLVVVGLRVLVARRVGPRLHERAGGENGRAARPPPTAAPPPAGGARAVGGAGRLGGSGLARARTDRGGGRLDRPRTRRRRQSRGYGRSGRGRRRSAGGGRGGSAARHRAGAEVLDDVAARLLVATQGHDAAALGVFEQVREGPEAVVGLVEGRLLALHGLLDHGAPEHFLVLALEGEHRVHQQREDFLLLLVGVGDHQIGRASCRERV